MKSRLATWVAVLVVVFSANLCLFGQVTGSISGLVADSNGAVVPNATVEVKGPSGQDFTVTTNDNGFFRVPALGAGTYSVTVSANGFKKSVVNNVKVDIGTPATANVVLEAGNISEVVEVSSGGEVLQTTNATVGNSITGRQINQTPIASRDALDLILRLPGVASVGAPRQSSVNGLPKGAIQLSLDGVDVQDNYLRSGDGFFTYVRPRVDAIEEVVVSTASPGAESTGDGAVQVRFVTKRGTNAYRGSAYWQVRNTWLNAAYWYTNRDSRTVGVNNIDGKALRDKSNLNQPGFAVGGPIPFPHFGEGGPYVHSGKDKLFFFTNYEIFKLPGSQARTRVVLTDAARTGLYSYRDAGGTVRQVNLFSIAAANGQVSTIDPTVAGVLGQIAGTLSQGTLAPIPNDLNRQNFSFSNPTQSERRFFVLRIDANVTKNHSASYIMNRQNFLPSVDVINGQDSPFPGGRSYGQGGIRKSWSYAVRSTFSQNIVNEANFGVSAGKTEFAIGCCAEDFASQGGRVLGIGGSMGITNFRSISGNGGRTSPTREFTDNLTWSRGNHTFSFGGQAKRIQSTLDSQTCCPSVGFGIIESEEQVAFNMFNETTMPGGSGVWGEARAFYAALAGRVTSFGQTASVDLNGNYTPGAPEIFGYQQWTYGLYAQDSWRIRPNLSVTLGLRWQPRMAVTARSANLTRLENDNMLYGQSGGLSSMYRPGPLATTVVPRTVPYAIGDKLSRDNINNFAPSFGAVWSPNFSSGGFFRRILGESGKSVFRGGWSRSFVREGLAVPDSLLSGNPGYAGSLDVSRTFANGQLTPGTLLRTPNNPNLTPYQVVLRPTFPINALLADQPGIYDPDVRTGKVDSFSFGYQRELDRNTVIELRYVGNRGRGLERQRNINELNTIENGVFAEYKLAQQNLYANIAANRCQANITTANCQYNFAYFGPGTGTSPLPITLAYFNAVAASLTAGALGQSGSVTSAGAQLPTAYTSSNFRSTTYTTSLNRVATVPLNWANALRSTATQRNNAVTAGLPANFLQVNHINLNGAWIIDNTHATWYDSAVIEVRRRLSQGLRVQASYVFSKSQSNFFGVSSVIAAQSFTNREYGEELAKTLQPFDLRHNFKLDTTYDIPLGRGRAFFSNVGRLGNALIGGFSILPVVTWTSGAPIQIGNAQLVGMTVKELEKAVKIRKEANAVFWLPDDIILNSRRAFATSVTTASGYSATVDGQAPTGRFIAPSGFGNCQAAVGGTCGFNNIVIHGPGFYKFDLGINKRFDISERFNVELRANLLDALNHANFKVGGFAANTTGSGCCGATFGQLGAGSAYRDNNTTNDPGGRVIDLQVRINF